MASFRGKKTNSGVSGKTVEDAQNRNNEEVQHDHDSLTQAKDRAQITSSTAMSVVNVALLREIMDRGHDQNRFYTVSICIISAALILQILAGLLSIMVANMISYKTNFGSNVCDDVMKNLCPCTCRRRKKTNGKRSASSRSMYKGITIIECDEPETELEDVGCCPCKIKTELFGEFEYKIINQYHDMRHGQVQADMQAIIATKELEFQIAIIENLNERIAKTKAQLEMTGLGEEMQAELNEKLIKLKEDLEEAMNSKTEYDAQIRQNEITNEKANLLKSFAESYRKNRIMKMISFWQNVINYFLYAVFILNAFLVGFGIASSPQQGTISNTTSVANASI